MQQAPDTTTKAPKPALNFGELFSRTFKIIGENFALFLFFTILALIPSTIIDIYFPELWQQPFFVTAAAGIGFLFYGSLMEGFFACATFLTLRQEPVSIGICLSRTLRRFPAMVLTSLLFTLGISFGAMLLLIPAIIFACAWHIALPLCVIEGHGAATSLDRSWTLTKGYRGYVFLLLLLSVAVPQLSIVALVYLPSYLALAVGILVFGAITIFDGVSRTVLYAMLRFLKEGNNATVNQGANQLT